MSRVCLVHGYLLRGTGSNIYVKNLARTLCSLGHDVSIVCQESGPQDIDFISEAWAFEADNSKRRLLFNRETPYPGKCACYRPNLEQLLVYVHDEYPGFNSVKTLQEADIEEIEEFAERNMRALRRVVDEKRPDWIQANHSLMQPYIVRGAVIETMVPYAVTLHGSDLNFSVKRDPRLHRFMVEGLRKARKVCAVSEFNAQDMRDYLAGQGEEPLEIGVIPAGVDTDEFRPLTGGAAAAADVLLEAMLEFAELYDGGETPEIRSGFIKALPGTIGVGPTRALFDDKRRRYIADQPDLDVVERLRDLDWGNEKPVVFVGKYLWTKGAQALLCAAPLVLRRFPEARFILVGFGKSREMIQALLWALAGGDAAALKRLLHDQPNIDAGNESGVEPVCLEFIERLEEAGELAEYMADAVRLNLAERMILTGIMSHRELQLLLPLADAFCAPSLFPEAFGMVAAEAMACGVLPIVTYSYGLKEIQDLIEEKFSDIIELERLEPGADLVEALARNIIRVLEEPKTRDGETRNRLHDLVDERFGWGSVAERYLHLMA